MCRAWYVMHVVEWLEYRLFFTWVILLSAGLTEVKKDAVQNVAIRSNATGQKHPSASTALLPRRMRATKSRQSIRGHSLATHDVCVVFRAACLGEVRSG